MKQNSYELELLSKQAHEEILRNIKKTRNIKIKGELSQYEYEILVKNNRLLNPIQIYQKDPNEENYYSTNLSEQSEESGVIKTDPKGDYIVLSKEHYLNILQTLFQAKNYIMKNQEFMYDSTVQAKSNNIIRESLVQFLQLVEDFVSKIVTNQYDIQKSIKLFENQIHIHIEEQSQTKYFLEQIKNSQNFPVFDPKILYKERREDFFKKNQLLGNSRNFQSIFKKVDIFDRDIHSLQSNENVDKIHNKMVSREQTDELIKVIYELEYCKLYLGNYQKLSQLLNERQNQNQQQ